MTNTYVVQLAIENNMTMPSVGRKINGKEAQSGIGIQYGRSTFFIQV